MCVCVNQEASGLEPFFFSPLFIVETENPRERLPRGDGRAPPLPPAVWARGSLPAAHRAGLPPRTPPAARRPPRVSARRPGHLSRQLPGNPAPPPWAPARPRQPLGPAPAADSKFDPPGGLGGGSAGRRPPGVLSRRPLGRLPPWEGVGLLSAGQPCAAQVMGKVLQDFSPRGPGAAPRTSPFGGLGCPLGSYRMPVEPSPYHGGNLSRGLEEAERCV